MNRVLTALALSGMFVAAPAFAKVSHQGRRWTFRILALLLELGE